MISSLLWLMLSDGEAVHCSSVRVLLSKAVLCLLLAQLRFALQPVGPGETRCRTNSIVREKLFSELGHGVLHLFMLEPVGTLSAALFSLAEHIILMPPVCCKHPSASLQPPLQICGRWMGNYYAKLLWCLPGHTSDLK